MTLNIVSGKIARAVKTVIYGTEGVGKSTLASRFPEPLFIDIEGGTSQLDVRRIEASQDWEELLGIVNEVAVTQKVCRTLVIDTADAAESLCVKYVCTKYKQVSIESFGYGRGYTYLAEEWGRFMAACDSLIEGGINVTIITHARQRKIELPEQTGSFDHWEMKLTRQVAPILKEWADLLLFCNYKTFVVTTDNNSRKAQGGKRMMYTSHNPVYDAKNRFGLPDEMDLDYANLAPIFADIPKQQTSLDRLRAMMEEAGITDYQLREVVSAKDHYPIETPLDDYSEKIVNGFCIKHFDKIVSMIKEKEIE